MSRIVRGKGIGGGGMEHRIFQDAHRSVAVGEMRTKTGAAGGGMVVERVKEAVDLC